VRSIYLDNNATTRTDPAVVDAMLPFFSEQFGNPSSVHVFGAEVGAAMKQARRSLLTLIGAAFDREIIFTSVERSRTTRLFFRRSNAGRP